MAAPMIGAGDTLPGHPPIPLRREVPNRAGFLFSVMNVLVTALQIAGVWARRQPGLLVDVIGLGALTYGVALTWGPGPGWVVAGVSVLLAHQFSDPPATRPDQA